MPLPNEKAFAPANFGIMEFTISEFYEVQPVVLISVVLCFAGDLIVVEAVFVAIVAKRLTQFRCIWPCFYEMAENLYVITIGNSYKSMKPCLRHHHFLT